MSQAWDKAKVFEGDLIMKTLGLLGLMLLSVQVANAAEDLWTWMISGQERLVVRCHQRGVVHIDSFDSELQLIQRITDERGCARFDVLHVQSAEKEAWLENIHLNATVYGLDRLKRSPSELIDWGLFSTAIYPVKLLAIRVQTKRLGNKLSKFLELKEYPRAERVSKNYFRLFVEQAQLAHEDYLTLSR